MVDDVGRAGVANCLANFLANCLLSEKVIVARQELIEPVESVAL